MNCEGLKEWLANLRGTTPDRCDFCGEARPFSELEPEEGGAWVCTTCMARWEREERWSNPPQEPTAPSHSATEDAFLDPKARISDPPASGNQNA